MPYSTNHNNAFQTAILAAAGMIASPGDVLGPKRLTEAMGIEPLKRNCDRVNACIGILARSGRWPYKRPSRGNREDRGREEPSDEEKAAIEARIEEVRRQKEAWAEEPRFILKAHKCALPPCRIPALTRNRF
jgi:hypothetical protein